MHKSPQETQIEVREEEEGEEEEEEGEKSIRRNMKGLPARQALKKKGKPWMLFLIQSYFFSFKNVFFLIIHLEIF